MTPRSRTQAIQVTDRRLYSGDPETGATLAYGRGTATLAQHARIFQPVLVGLRRRFLPQLIAAEARERAGLSARGVDTIELICQRLCAYPPECGLPAPQQRALEEAVDVALAVPPEPGLLPDQARFRADCAYLVLFLGDETGARLRRRVWPYIDGAWRFAPDIAAAGRNAGLKAAHADDFMGTPRGFFEQAINQGVVQVSAASGHPGSEGSLGFVSFCDMATLVPSAEEVSDGQIWSTWAATS